MATKINYIKTSNITKSKLPLVIGYFGCVHVMHGQLLNANNRFNILTFADLPKKQESQIYSLKDRLINLTRFRPANIYVLDISKHNMKAADFIQKVLMKIQPSEIIVGTDFHFGQDHQSYKVLCKDFNVKTINYDPQISTTKIKKMLKNNQLQKANDFMYFPYYYRSEWVGGKKIGRTLGIRTVNQVLNHDCPLPYGSYATIMTIGKKQYKSVSFLGCSKTISNKSEEFLETHALNANIPPRSLFVSNVRKNVKIEFFKFLRTNKKFKNKELLIKAIKNDIQIAKDYFERLFK